VTTHRKIDGLSAMLISSGVSLATSVPAQAAPAPEVVQIQEMIVTSRAREEALQDVPISVSLVSGDMIDEGGIRNLEDLANSVPNFTVTQDPIGDKINIRGIFTSEVPSLEQSVSTFVDGVNRGRGTQARFAFLDLERVEVLRGPQGTLFGKNTVGGALNLITRKPTTDFAASFNAGFEPELEETTVGGFLSGPLSDTVRGRLAYAGSDQNEGFIENTFYGESTPTSRNNSVRGILDLDVTPKTLLRLRTEYQDFDFDGQPLALRSAGLLAPLLQSFGVKSGSLTRTAIGQAPGGPLDTGSNGTMEGDSQEVALTLEQGFESGASLEIVGAFSALDFKRRIDVDFSPLDLVGFDDSEDYEQTSFSLRFLSPDEGRVRYVAGLYYQQVDLELAALTSFNPVAAQNFFIPVCQAAGLSPADAAQLTLSTLGINGQTPADAASQLARAGSAAVVENCGTLGASLVLPAPLARANSLSQEGEALAVYGQADIDLTSNLQLTVGLRYTVEDKEARQTLFASTFGVRQPIPNPDLNTLAALGLFLEATPHDFGPDLLDRSENKVTYSASLQWAVTDQVNTYLSTSSGFKAGGFNSVAFGPDPANAEFDSEEVTAYELGVKTKLLDGKATFNAAFFFTEIEDLQVAQFSGDASFIVQNAAEAEVQGVELDARFQLSKDLGLSFAAAYTDFEFTAFPNAGCTTQQLQGLRQAAYDLGAAQIAAGNPAGFTTQLLGSIQTLQNCAALKINDLRGRTAEQVPEYTAQLGIDYHLEFANGFAIDTLAEVVWNDRQFRQTDLDPVTESASFAKTNLSLSLYRMGTPWTLMLVGRNIFDKETFSYANDTPVFENARQQIVDRPRTVKLQLQYDFE